jgi:NitT/TauT family transport system ATP-binding protein
MRSAGMLRATGGSPTSSRGAGPSPLPSEHADIAFRVTDLSKSYFAEGQLIKAMESVSLEIPDRSFVSIVGPSGCGKSTLLKMLLGVERPTGGSITYHGREIRGVLPNVGYVPQHDSLLPWRTVRGNIGLGLELRGVPKRETQQRVDDLLELVGLTAFAKAFPRQLSGGMRKRASLARALAYRADAVLMDEPFGALDAQMKDTLHRELMSIWEAQRLTVLFVTHDLEEAILLSDVVVVLGRSPSVVKAVQTVNLPRPRNLTEDRFKPEFRALYTTLWESLDKELSDGETDA